MNARKALVIFIIIAILASRIPIIQVSGATGSYYPEHTTDDAFITTIGAYFGTTGNLPLRSGTTDIISGLRFQNLSIAQGAKINNATLFVRTLYTFDSGTNISVTIYGVAENDAYPFNSSGDFTRSYTSNHINWNVTGVNGNAWHNVSVTEIVQEIIARYGWRSGNSLAFLILCDEGDPRREFATIDQNVAYRPRLDITYDVTPPDPSSDADPPYNDTSLWTWELNDTYRGFDIWDVIYSNINRTGEGCDVDWSEVNMTELTEMDAGADIVVNNATWATVTRLVIPTRGSLFNDTGSANINSYFLRFSVNMTEVFKGGAETVIPSFFSLSTISPAAASVHGYAYGTSGDWVGLVCIVHADQTQWRVSIRERTGGAGIVGSGTGWVFSTADRNMIYWECKINMSGVPYIMWTYYYDPEFQTAIASASRVLVHATGPFRYPQTLAGMGLAGTNRASFEYYTYLDFNLSLPSVTFITYPNGTLINGPIDEDEDPEDIIDEILGGAEPEDPESDYYGTALTKNRWKMFIFVIGMVMFLGTPTIGIMSKAGIGRWYMILFVSLCGLALLWSLRYM